MEEKIINENVLLNAKQVAKIMNIGTSRAYDVMRELNQELTIKGFYTIPNRISRVYLLERIRGYENANK